MSLNYPTPEGANNPLGDIVYYFNTIVDNWEVRLSFGVVIGWLAGLIGLDAEILATLTSFMIFDYMVGLLAAVKTRTFSWYVFVRGVSKFFAYYVTIFLVGTIEKHLPPVFAQWFPVLSITISYLFLIEAGSIVRHLAVLGVVFPPLVLHIVEKSKTKLEDAVKNKLDGNNMPEGYEKQERQNGTDV